jgi:hypothetical protein
MFEGGDRMGNKVRGGIALAAWLCAGMMSASALSAEAPKPVAGIIAPNWWS